MGTLLLVALVVVVALPVAVTVLERPEFLSVLSRLRRRRLDGDGVRDG